MEALLKTLLTSILLVFIFEASAATKIYKVVRADGSIIYTDKPGNGATEFELKSGSNIIDTPSKPATTQPGNNLSPNNSANRTPSKQTNYQINIASPANEATIRSNEGRVNITANLTPMGAGTFQLYLNGELVQHSNSPQFLLEGLERGEYNAQIRFLDQTGKLLALSSISKFYLQKVSALLRPN